MKAQRREINILSQADKNRHAKLFDFKKVRITLKTGLLQNELNVHLKYMLYIITFNILQLKIKN